jgi:tRNA(Ile)-lysidine synthase
MLPSRVSAFIARHAMFAAGSRVLVGVSGGGDSVGLLHCLVALREGLGIELAVGHVEHGLRGDASRDDMRFVEGLAAELTLPFVSEAVDVRSRVAETGECVEEAARHLRRAALLREAREVRAQRVALGHTADDRVETVLLNLFRGAGSRGLSAMRPVAPDGVVRPLLAESRSAVRAYITNLGAAYRDDETNADTTYLRNRLRHDVLPAIASISELNPRAAILRHARLASLERDGLAYFADAYLDRHGKLSHDDLGHVVRVDMPALSRLPDGALFALLRRACERVTPDLAGLSLAQIEEIAKLVRRPRTHAFRALPCGVRVDVGRGYMRFRACHTTGLNDHRDEDAGPLEAEVMIPGRTVVPGLGIEVNVEAPGLGRSSSDAAAVLNLDCAPRPWQVRAWRPGDRIRPVGLGGTKKLKQLFQERHVPLDERAVYPVIEAADGELLWVPGLALAERARPSEDAVRVARFTVRPIADAAERPDEQDEDLREGEW